MVKHGTLHVETRGFSDIKDITARVQNVVEESKIKNGLAHVFAVGSTASISTIEYEPALVKDMQEFLEKLVPSNLPTRHGSTWGDDNGFSHIRATFMGPGMSVPIEDGRLVLGTWQQIVVIDHDNRPRNREIRVQIIGE